MLKDINHAVLRGLELCAAPCCARLAQRAGKAFILCFDNHFCVVVLNGPRWHRCGGETTSELQELFT